MEKISAIIITQNEERNIGRCLNSLIGIADEVVVVDSGSTDGTERICREHGALFHHHPWEGYSAQKNHAETLSTGDWTLSIDADEALSDELRQSLLLLKGRDADPDMVFCFNRLTNYCGTWIRHCGWYPDEKIRLWRRGTCRWSGIVHEEPVFCHPVRRQRLDGDLLHYSYYSVEEHASRQITYAQLAAKKSHDGGKRFRCGDLLLRPAWTFLRNYLFKGGFLDGRTGFTVCRMAAFYTLIKYARLRELGGTGKEAEVKGDK